MHRHFGDWLRRIHPEPTSDYVKMRSAAADAVVEKASAEDALALARLVWSVPPQDIAFETRFAESFLVQDAAFPMTENMYQLRVLAGAALGELMTLATPVSDIAALASISAASAGLRTDCALPEIVDEAESYLLRVGKARRLPASYKESPVQPALEASARKALKDYGVLLGQNAWADAATAVSGAVTQLAKTAEDLLDRCDALYKEVRVQTEQNDILWWLFGGFSQNSNVSFSAIKPAAAVLMIGRDLACLSRLTPGPMASEAFLAKMLAQTKLTRKKFSIHESVNAVEAQLRQRWIAENGGARVGLLCPITFAIARSVEEGAAKLHAASVPFDKPVSTHELASQLFTETLLLRELERNCD
jgi:hypothetical protein